MIRAYYIRLINIERPNNQLCLPCLIGRKRKGANLTEPLNDTKTVIYGQSTNGAGDRSAGGSMRSRRAIIIVAKYTRASPSLPPPRRPSVCFYFIIPASSHRRIAAGASTHIHGLHNSPRKPVSPVHRDAVSQRVDSVFRCPSLLPYTYRWSRYDNSTGDFAWDPAAYKHLRSPIDLSINLESIFSLSNVLSFFI